MDLKGKLNLVEEPNFQNTKLEDVEQALLALGYNKKEIGKVLPKLDQTQDEGILVKQALQALVK